MFCSEGQTDPKAVGFELVQGVHIAPSADFDRVELCLRQTVEVKGEVTIVRTRAAFGVSEALTDVGYPQNLAGTVLDDRLDSLANVREAAGATTRLTTGSCLSLSLIQDEPTSDMDACWRNGGFGTDRGARGGASIPGGLSIESAERVATATGAGEECGDDKQ